LAELQLRFLGAWYMQLQEIEDLELEVCQEHLNESFSYTKYKYKYLNYLNLSTNCRSILVFRSGAVPNRA